MKISRLVKQFNPRFFVVRLLVNAIAVLITAAVTPKIYFEDRTVLSWLLITVTLGILNALLKPVLQFLTLQFIFVTYGLVIVLVNSLMLLLLSALFPERFVVANLLWALVGGLVLGLVSSFLESLLGLTMPIVPEEESALRRRLEEQARPIEWHAAARREAVSEEGVPALEPPAMEADPAGSAEAVTAVTESVAVEPSPPIPDEGPSPTAVEVETTDARIPVEPEPVSEQGEGEKEPEPVSEPGEEEEADRS